MTLARLTFALAFATTAAAACSVQTTAGRDGTEATERGLGKADGVYGSCGNGHADFCGSFAPGGNCWCDELCADYGDCCADKVDVCGGEDNIDPTPALCLSDDACGDGEICDHSVCLSGCPAGGICPAVCYGQCVEGGGDTPPQCNSLDKKECNDTEGCSWKTSPGFPGPISMCVDEDEDTCDINPLTVLCSDGTFFSVEECACVAPEPPPPPAGDCEPDDSYVAVSGEELSADPSAFVGERVWLTGEAEVGFPICTQLACFPEAPCCNNCGAGITMVTGDTELEMAGIGCGGNNCDVLANCDYPDGTGFTAWGTLNDTFGILVLEVDGHCGT